MGATTDPSADGPNPPCCGGQPANPGCRQRRCAGAAAVGLDVPAVLLAWFPEDALPSTTPVDGVLAYDEGPFIGRRPAHGKATPRLPGPEEHVRERVAELLPAAGRSP